MGCAPTSLFVESAGEGDGVATFGEAFAVQPFGNTLVTFPMTGAQIVSVLEEQCQPPGSSRPFLHLGVSEGFTYDLATTFDGTPNCTSVSVTNVRLGGVALDPAQTYNVTVNNFLADGGDNFDTFATITAPRLDGGDDLLALTNYLGTFSPIAATRRSIGSTSSEDTREIRRRTALVERFGGAGDHAPARWTPRGAFGGGGRESNPVEPVTGGNVECADRVIDYTTHDFVASGERYDVMFDNVGNRSPSECRRMLTRMGSASSSAGRRRTDCSGRSPT